MAVRLSNAAARAACDAINNLINAGSAGAATLVVYSGARPADVDTDVVAQVALVVFNLPSPAFAPAVDAGAGGHATANAITSVVAAATGTASFFRIYNRDGDGVFDGSVTDTAGAGDLKLSSTAVIKDIDVSVVSLTTTMPKA